MIQRAITLQHWETNILRLISQAIIDDDAIINSEGTYKTGTAVVAELIYLDRPSVN